MGGVIQNAGGDVLNISIHSDLSCFRIFLPENYMEMFFVA